MTDTNPWDDVSANPWQSNLTSNANDGAPPLESGRIDVLDFWDAIKQNRRNTFILIFGMLCLSGAFGYILGWAWDLAFGGQMAAGMQYLSSGQIDWVGIIITPSVTGIKAAIALLSAMLVWTGYTLMRADKVILSMAGARETTANELPQLHNVIEEVAVAAGVPKPKIFLVKTDMPNAFATGLHTDRAAVGITSGLLSRLNRRELQAVMAHEIGHIMNGDMRYATIMSVMTGVLVFVAQMVMQSRRFLFVGNNNGNRRGRGGHPFVLIIMVVIFMITAVLVPILARIIQMAISRQREYLADATAVQLTRDPGGLITALQKIASSDVHETRVNQALEPLLFMAPQQMLHNGNMAWFSTHPPVERRIERLKALE